MKLVDKFDVKKIIECVAILQSCFFIFIPSSSLITVTQYCAIWGFFIILLSGISFSSVIKINIYDIFLILFISICFFSAVYSLEPMVSLRYCVIISLCFFMYMYFSYSSHWTEFFISVISVIAIINAIITIWSFISFDSFSRVVSSFITAEALSFAARMRANTNAYAGIMGQTGVNAFSLIGYVPIAIWNIKNKKNKVLHAIGISLVLFAVILTKKRGHVLWMLVSVLFLYVLYQKRTGRRFGTRFVKLVTFLMVLIIGVYVLYNTVPEVTELVDRFNVMTDKDITSGRRGMAEKSYEVIKKYPFGIGIDAYSTVYGENVHNDFLQIIAETGLGGLISFLVYIISVVLAGIKRYVKSEGDTRLLIFLNILIYQICSFFTSFPLHTYGYCIQLFLVIAGIKALIRKEVA